MNLDVVMRPDTPWPVLRDEWLRAERLGIGRGWLSDRLNHFGHEAFTTLGAAAAVTSRIGVGALVTSSTFRHPVTSAKAALGLDALSGGRFALGVSAGGPSAGSDAVGTKLTRPERLARFREWITLTDQLLRTDRVVAAGRYFTVPGMQPGESERRPAGGEPQPAGARNPPLGVAATDRQGMALAAEFADLWITHDFALDRSAYVGAIPQQVAVLAEVCAEHGRDPETLPRLAVLGFGDERPLDSIEAFRDCVGRYTALGIGTLAVHWPRGDLTVLEQAAAEVSVPGPSGTS